jgi:fructose 1,6-bisphosphatase
MIALSLVGAVIIAFADEHFVTRWMNEDHHRNLFTPGVKSPAPFARQDGYTVIRKDRKRGK